MQFEEKIKEGAKDRLEDSLIEFTTPKGNTVELFFGAIDGIKVYDESLTSVDPVTGAVGSEVALLAGGQEIPITRSREEVIEVFSDHVVTSGRGAQVIDMLKQSFSGEGDSLEGLTEAAPFSPINFNQSERCSEE